MIITLYILLGAAALVAAYAIGARRGAARERSRIECRPYGGPPR